MRAASAVSAAEPWIVADLRKVAAAACAGLVAGLAVNAVGGRLAMMLLALLNPEVSGRLSDDGFPMGRFDLVATLNLVLFATALGVLGGLALLAVRQLRFGPAWFRTASMTLGPAVVVGASLVHRDGVDFVILQPVWLAITLFVALPGLFAYVVSRLADRWLEDGSWFLTGGRSRLLALAPVILLAPALPIVAVGAAARVVYRTVPALRRSASRRGAQMMARASLAAMFTVALVDLTADVVALI